jgi:hypothetical protein
VLAVGIDVFHSSNVVVDCLVGTAGSMTDGPVDASPGDSEDPSE